MRFNLQLFKYDKDLDYSTEINNAIARGASADEVQRLQNERNEKIADDKNLSQYADSSSYGNINTQATNYINNNSSSKKTNGGGGGGSYSNTPTDSNGNIDYSAILNAGLGKTWDSYSDEELNALVNAANARANKLTGMTNDPNYQEYMKQQNDYINALNEIAYRKNQQKSIDESYKDQQKRNQEIWDEYESLSKKMSNYDFQQTEEYKTLLPIYQEMYRQLGEDARKNTLADATGLTGGLTNSYAIAASQQAQNDYNSRFTQDVIPQLMDLAYNRYANGANFELENLNSAQSLLDKIANADQNYLNNMYNFNRANRADYESDRNFNEGVRQYDQNFDYQKERDRAADDKWNKEFEQSLKEYQDGLSLSYAKLAKSGGSTKDNGSLGGYSDGEIYQAALGAYQEMLYLDDPSSWYKKSHSVDIGDGWKQTETNLDVVSEYGPKFFTYLEQISKQAGNTNKNLLPDDEEKIY